MPTKRSQPTSAAKHATAPAKAPARKVAKLSAPVFSQDGARVGDVDLDPRVFGVTVAPKLLTKAVLVQRANARPVLADTKTRGERRGGGRKPWKQKGTGRARHGSIRSPQWRKGGVVFGPHKERNFTAKLNRKERRRAILGALSLVARREAGVVVLEELTLTEIKTARVAGLLRKLPVTRTTLLVLPDHNDKVELSARNIPHLKTQLATNLNVVDLLGHRHLVLSKAALELVRTTYAHE
ncbi:MAG: 50S ribosomal protein L4 [Candidatus Andersenbacteria bacterium]